MTKAYQIGEEFVAKGVKSVRRLLDILIGAGSAGKGAFFSGFQQATENGFDAHATSVCVLIDKRDQVLRIIDNGEGFGQKQINGFFSLFVSPKEGVVGLIGKNGSGRIFLLNLAEEILVFSRSSEFPQMISFVLHRSDIEDLLNKEYIEVKFQVVKSPSWWTLPGTGSAICLQNVNWSLVPSPSEVLNRGSGYLKPSLARMVEVNGERLKPRAIVGEVIHVKVTVPYLSGVQEIELYIPQNRSKLDTIRLGGINYICPLRDMLNQLSPEIQAMIPQELFGGTVCGDILIPAINNFRAHDGRSLEDAFFQSGIQASVVQFLIEEVAPRIVSAFEHKKKADEGEERAEVITSISESFNQAFRPTNKDLGEGAGPGTEGDHDDGKRQLRSFHVTPVGVVLVPGEEQSFRVRRFDGASGRFQWDAKGSGGTLDRKTGKAVTYTAGKSEGRFGLVIRDQRDPDKEAVVKITIISEKQMMISPIRIDIPAGGSQEFRLLNHDVTSGDIRWELVGAHSSITLSRSSGLRTKVNTLKSASLGDYVLRAVDEQDKDKCVEATFEVVDPFCEDGIVKIEDRIYILESASMTNPNMVERQKGRKLDRTHVLTQTPRDVMVIDFTHPTLKAIEKLTGTTSSEAYKQAIFPHVVMAHLQGLIEDREEQFDEIRFRGRVAEILRQVMEARVKAVAEEKEGEE